MCFIRGASLITQVSPETVSIQEIRGWSTAKTSSPSHILVTYLDLEEGIASAVADITSTDHVHTPSNTCPLDNGYHWFWTLHGQCSQLYKSVCVTVCACMCFQVEGN